jgi:VWFA-related protein
MVTAQASIGPSVSINYVDKTNFPEVRVYVSVLEADGAPKLNIPKESFALTESGASVNIDSLSSQLDQASVVMMLDTTGSMLDPDSNGNLPINLLKNSAAAFVQRMSPQDVFAIYTFNEKSALRCDFTSDRKILGECISNINAEPKDTAIWDSAMDAVKKAAEIPRGRRAVVLFTDGDDNLSKRFTLDDIIRQAAESEIPVYTIAAYSKDLAAQPGKLNSAITTLNRLSSNTRGQSLTSRLVSDLPKLFDRLTAQLKGQYVLVYTSSAAEGKTDLTVRVKDVQGNDAIIFLVPSLQSTIPPAITQIDISRFPVIKAYVSAPALPAGVPVTPTIANFVVTEDRSRIPFATLDIEKRGTLLHILIDTNADLNVPGATKEKIWLEERRALLELVADNTIWLDRQGRKDLVGAETPTNDTNHPNIVFSNDYNLLRNFAYSDQTPARSQTPFDQIVRKGVDTIIQYNKSEGRRRLLLVLTNGIQSNVDQSKLQDAADVAKRNGISVFVIYFGNSDASRPAILLKRIASLANWRYYWFTSLESITPVYQQIGNFGNQYVLTFRSKASGSGNHITRVTISGGGASPTRAESFAESQYSIDLQPPDISLALNSSQGIVRNGGAWNTAPIDAEPKIAQIALQVKWRDGHARKINQIIYSFDNGPERVATDFSQDTGVFQADIKDLDDGPHALNVTVEDELGQTQSTTLSVPVRINLPFTGVLVRFFTRVFPVAALLGSLVVLGIAFYIYRTRPPVVMNAIGNVQRGVKVATDFFVRKGKGEGKIAKAHLVPLAGADTQTGPIPIYSETTRLGRDDTMANIILQDSTVSRLHAKIVEEADGNFKIYDEGSRSGTYVNDEEVKMQGQWLHDGDTVAFGRDEFQFKLKLGPKESTEIFERMSRKASTKEETDATAGTAKNITDARQLKAAKEQTDVSAKSSAKEETDTKVSRTAKEETDIKNVVSAKQETDVPVLSTAKEETDITRPVALQAKNLLKVAYLVPVSSIDSKQGSISLDKEVTLIGRDNEWASVVFTDASVSRRHAKIVNDGKGNFMIRDEGSKGGTLVNNDKVSSEGILLQEGDIIKIGSNEFRFKLIR